MHPILGKGGRLGLFLVAWVVTATLFLFVALDPGEVSFTRWTLFIVPLAVLHAFFSLAAWFPCRVTPLRSSTSLRIFSSHALGAVVASLVWLLFALVLASVTDSLGGSGFTELVLRNVNTLIGLGVILYLVSVTVFYLIIEFESARVAESRQLELAVLAREAELSALKARIDPHFLFNSLNAVASLCGSDPAKARTMSILLADFLRSSLRMDRERTITLSDEWNLAVKYLEIEKVRFGDRLIIDSHIEPAAATVLVPPLLLQPLLENAVRHGIANLIEGGTIRVDASVSRHLLSLQIDNPVDGDAPAQSGEGIGLGNVIRRLDMVYGREAVVETTRHANRFRVSIVLPVMTSEQ